MRRPASLRTGRRARRSIRRVELEVAVFIGVPERTARGARRIGRILAATISLDSHIPELRQLISELSQVTYTHNLADKVRVDKAPDGARSPNIADSVVIAFCPAPNGMEAWRILGKQP